MTLTLTFLDCLKEIYHLLQLVVLILLPVNFRVGHGSFGVEVEIGLGLTQLVDVVDAQAKAYDQAIRFSSTDFLYISSIVMGGSLP